MSLFPEEDILTKEIETWRGFIDKLPLDDDRKILTKLLDDCYKYSVAINNHVELHPFPSESLVMSLLLSQKTKNETATLELNNVAYLIAFLMLA